MADRLAVAKGLRPDLVTKLRRLLDGAFVLPDEPGYDGLRSTWKGYPDKRPLGIARVANTSEVVQTVALAREHHLPIAVRAGGHDVAGRSVVDGALQIDLSRLSGMAIDPGRGQAVVGAGVQWHELVDAAAPHGLATTGASVATVGVSGFTLSGGFGWLMRRCGTASDNLLAATLVTADGDVLEVDDRTPDLAWALRGAGPNFGVVTRFVLRLHPVSHAVAGVLVFDGRVARDLLLRYRDLTARAPDDLMIHYYGLPMGACGLGICHVGPPERAAAFLASILSIPGRIGGELRSVAYRDVQHIHDSSTPSGSRYCVRAGYLPELRDALVDVLAERVQSMRGRHSKIFIEHLGGAVARADRARTSFQHFGNAYSFLTVAGWEGAEGDDAHQAWAREVASAVAPFYGPGAYPNYLDDDEDERIAAAFGSGYERLRTLKRRWDPANVFRANRNIPPAAASPR